MSQLSSLRAENSLLAERLGTASLQLELQAAAAAETVTAQVSWNRKAGAAVEVSCCVRFTSERKRSTGCECVYLQNPQSPGEPGVVSVCR